MLKKLTKKVVDLMTYGENKNRTYTPIIVGMIAVWRDVPIKILFVIVIISSLIVFAYVIMYFKIRKNNLLGGVTLIAFFLEVLLSTGLFLELKNIDAYEDILIAVGLVLLVILCILAYLNVLKTGDEDRISEARTALIFGIPLLLGMIILVLW